MDNWALSAEFSKLLQMSNTWRANFPALPWLNTYFEGSIESSIETELDPWSVAFLALTGDRDPIKLDYLPMMNKSQALAIILTGLGLQGGLFAPSNQRIGNTRLPCG